MKRCVLGLAAASLVFTGAALAQGDYAAAYKAYTEAQAAGDAEATRRHAEAAWRAGREALPPGETLALLAQNYVWEVLWTDPAGALAPAAQALSLAEQGYGLGNMSLEELRFAAAYPEVMAAPDRQGAERLAALLDEDRATGRALTPFQIAAHDVTFRLAFGEARHGLAYDLQTKLVRELQAAETDGDLAALIARRQVFRAAALLAAGRRIDSDIGPRNDGSRVWPLPARIADAHVLIDDALDAIPPARTLAEVTPLGADAWTWHAVARSLADARGVDLNREHSFDGLASKADSPPLVQRVDAQGAPMTCELSWKQRRMDYPPDLDRAHIGAVVIGYHVAPDGQVTDARILSEVPSRRFGAHVLGRVQRWEADAAGTPDACLRDHTTQVLFTF